MEDLWYFLLRKPKATTRPRPDLVAIRDQLNLLWKRKKWSGRARAGLGAAQIWSGGPALPGLHDVLCLSRSLGSFALRARIDLGRCLERAELVWERVTARRECAVLAAVRTRSSGSNQFWSGTPEMTPELGRETPRAAAIGLGAGSGDWCGSGRADREARGSP